MKSNNVESLEHTFLVQNIKQVITPFVKAVKVNIVKDVDLLILNKKDQEIAIEVKTGKGFSKHKKRILHKFREVSRKYPNLLIVLTDTNYKNHYRRLLKGLNVEIITRNEIVEIMKTKKNKKK